MKQVLCLGTLMLALTASAIAGLDVPRSVYKMDTLEEAKSKAAESGKPLVFVYTDPGTTWGPCLATSSEAFKTFKSVGVLVFADSKADGYAALPKGAKDARAEAGNSLPMVLVTTADGSTALKGVSYDTLKNDCRKAAREVKKTIKEMNVVGDTPPGEEPAVEKTKIENWTNTDGKTIKASVMAIEESRVQFELENGKTVWYPINKLSTDSKKKLQERE